MAYVSRSCLNPPRGSATGFSMGLISDQASGVSLALTLVDATSTNRLHTQDSVRVEYTVEIEAIGNHTDVEITLVFPQKVGGNAGVVIGAGATTAEVEDQFESDNPGWTASLTTDGSEYTLVLTKATLAAGSYTLDISDNGVVFDSTGWWYWNVDGSDYTPASNVVLSGTSNEVAATGETITVDVGDIAVSAAFDADPTTISLPVGFTVTFDNDSANSENVSVTLQITDAVTTSSPTLLANPDGFSVNSWTSPGGGVQWQCIMTRNGVASNATNTVGFETTPSATGTLALNMTATSTNYADTGSATTTVVP